MFGTSVNLKFREKYRNKRKLAMPSIATQTSPARSRAVSVYHGLPTPPASVPSSCSGSMNSSVASLHGPGTPYDVLNDAFEDVPAQQKPRVRVAGGSRRTRPSVHIHLDNVHVTPMQSPVARTSRMVDAGVQTDAPSVTAGQHNPNSLLNRIKRWIAPIKPFIDVLTTVGLFFLERVGFGIRLN